MEPIVTVEGYKILQNPEEAWRLLKDYYEKLGYHVVDPSTVAEKQVIEVKR